MRSCLLSGCVEGAVAVLHAYGEKSDALLLGAVCAGAACGGGGEGGGEGGGGGGGAVGGGAGHGVDTSGSVFPYGAHPTSHGSLPSSQAGRASPALPPGAPGGLTSSKRSSLGAGSSSRNSIMSVIGAEDGRALWHDIVRRYVENIKDDFFRLIGWVLVEDFDSLITSIPLRSAHGKEERSGGRDSPTPHAGGRRSVITWRDAITLLCCYGREEAQVSRLCRTLGNRLIHECGDSYGAVFCYLCAGYFEGACRIWFKELQAKLEEHEASQRQHGRKGRRSSRRKGSRDDSGGEEEEEEKEGRGDSPSATASSSPFSFVKKSLNAWVGEKLSTTVKRMLVLRGALNASACCLSARAEQGGGPDSFSGRAETNRGGPPTSSIMLMTGSGGGGGGRGGGAGVAGAGGRDCNEFQQVCLAYASYLSEYKSLHLVAMRLLLTAMSCLRGTMGASTAKGGAGGGPQHLLQPHQGSVVASQGRARYSASTSERRGSFQGGSLPEDQSDYDHARYTQRDKAAISLAACLYHAQPLVMQRHGLSLPPPCVDLAASFARGEGREGEKKTGGPAGDAGVGMGMQGGGAGRYSGSPAPGSIQHQQQQQQAHARGPVGAGGGVLMHQQQAQQLSVRRWRFFCLPVLQTHSPLLIWL